MAIDGDDCRILKAGLAMGRRETRLIAQLASVLEEVCQALQRERGVSVDQAFRDVLAGYVLQAYEPGVIDPLLLKEEVLNMRSRSWIEAAEAVRRDQASPHSWSRQ